MFLFRKLDVKQISSRRTSISSYDDPFSLRQSSGCPLEKVGSPPASFLEEMHHYYYYFYYYYYYYWIFGWRKPRVA